MGHRMTRRRPFSRKHLAKVPDQSCVYILADSTGQPSYVGKAGAGRCRDRLLEHLNRQDVPGVIGFRFRPTSGNRQAVSLEGTLIRRHQPRHNKRGK